VGKTHLARRLSAQTDAGLFEADALRDLALSQAAGPHDPALDRGTTEAYRLYGAPNPENILRGLTDVRAALSPWLVARLRDHPDAAIIEAAFWSQRPCLPGGSPVCCAAHDCANMRAAFSGIAPGGSAACALFGSLDACNCSC